MLLSFDLPSAVRAETYLNRHSAEPFRLSKRNSPLPSNNLRGCADFSTARMACLMVVSVSALLSMVVQSLFLCTPFITPLWHTLSTNHNDRTNR